MAEWTTEQKAVIIAFGDSIKDERPQFLDEGLRDLDDLITHIVSQALASVNDLEGEAESEMMTHLKSRMIEHTRRGLQRAVKGIAKECDNI
jgi:hypothetical protein